MSGTKFTLQKLLPFHTTSISNRVGTNPGPLRFSLASFRHGSEISKSTLVFTWTVYYINHVLRSNRIIAISIRIEMFNPCPCQGWFQSGLSMLPGSEADWNCCQCETDWAKSPVRNRFRPWDWEDWAEPSMKSIFSPKLVIPFLLTVLYHLPVQQSDGRNCMTCSK